MEGRGARQHRGQAAAVVATTGAQRALRMCADWEVRTAGNVKLVAHLNEVDASAAGGQNVELRLGGVFTERVHVQVKHGRDGDARSRAHACWAGAGGAGCEGWRGKNSAVSSAGRRDAMRRLPSPLTKFCAVKVLGGKFLSMSAL